MNVTVLDRNPQSGRQAETIDKRFTGFIDCDVHPFVQQSSEEFDPFLSERWREHRRTIGGRARQGLAKSSNYPRMSPGNGQRMDAWPPGGGFPGSDLPTMQAQLLDLFDVAYGLLAPLVGGAAGERNVEFGAAMATATNEWQLARWCDPRPAPEGRGADQHRARGSRDRGNRETRHRPPLRPGEHPAARPGTARAAPLLADPAGLRRRRISRCPCISAAPAAIRPPAAAGRRSITRNIRPTCRPCRRWSPAWCARACSNRSPI